ncbi:MAG TPA: sigma-70 family RNA polymerase sigma factor [Tepidisphaeraceae bacterium]|nr:sigma-70 family RNA polymerase sigma factor [Tepidisphaeraceae bacterium]
MEDLDDDYLIRLAVAGDGAALATLLHEAQPLLLRRAQKKLSPDLQRLTMPEDIVQETCLEATRLIRGFQTSSKRNLYAWLLRILHLRIQTVAQKHRTRVRLGAAAGFHDDPSIVGAIEELAIYRRTPSKSAAAHEFMAAVEQSLAKLPEQYRRVVTLRHLDGLSVEETAERMGKDHAAVSVLTTRALHALRERLKSASRFT